MAGKGRGGDGVDYLGLRDGKKWWRLRLEWTDPRTGKKRSTKQEAQADSKLLARDERARRIESKKNGESALTTRKKFGDAMDEYLATIVVYSTRRSWGYFAKRLRAQFGDWWVDKINERHLQDYLDSIDDLSTSSVASLRAILRKLFEYSIRRHWVAINPARFLKPRDNSHERVRRGALEDAPKRNLNLDEAAAFLSDFKTHNPIERYLLVATQMVMGTRYAEVSALLKSDLNLETGIVGVRRGQVLGNEGPTKGKYARVAALDLELRRDLKEHLERMAELRWPGWERLVFPRPPYGPSDRRRYDHIPQATVYGAIKRTLKRLGLEHMPVGTHIARHTMHNVAQEHASALLLRKVVGHKTEAMALNYTAAHAAKVIDLAERVSRDLKSGKTSGKVTSGGDASD